MPILLRVLALTAAFAVAVLIAPDDSRAIAPFDPDGFVCFESYETEPLCDGDPTPGASSDIRLRFCLGWNDLCSSEDSVVIDSAPAFVAGFIPLGFAPVSANDIPIGTIAGRAHAQQTYGTLSNPCSTVRSAGWTILNASINTTDEVDGSSAPAVFNDADGNGIQDGVDRFPSVLNDVLAGAQPRARYMGLGLVSGLGVVMVNALVLEPGASIHTSTGILSFDSSLGYPVVFLVGDPTAEPAPGPLSDYCAPFSAELVVFGAGMDNPCTPVPVPGAACPGGGTPIPAGGGYPLLPCETHNTHDEDGDGAVNDGCPQVNAISEADILGACDNAISDDLEDSDINDGCPQVGLFSEGERLPGTCAGSDEGGCPLLYNPSQPGTYNATAFSVGYHDADGDGIENPLDVCVLTPNADWDPRAPDTANDPDNDGLPNDCDPDSNNASGVSSQSCPLGIVGPDEDGDCFSNRADNCPLDNQLVDPLDEPDEVTNPPTQSDTDRDGIGDACDPNPQVADGERPGACLTLPIDVGVGASTAPQTPIKNLDSGFDCVGGFSLFPQDPDIDNDGICTDGIAPGDSGCTGVDNCPSVPNPNQQDSDGDGTGDACANQMPGAVGGFAGLAPEAQPPSASGDGSRVTLSLAAALVVGGALALGGGAWFALRQRR